MKHSIDPKSTGPFAEPMSKAIETCVHCGFCLPACPTYNVLGQEADSPRGRIFLMKQVLEGELEPDDVSEHVDQCLGCLACETACPSGVKYRDLVSPYRAVVPRKRGFWERVRDVLVANTIPYPKRFRMAMRLGGWMRSLTFLAPKPLRVMAEMVPKSLPPKRELKEFYPAQDKEVCRVNLLAGCAQQVLAPRINLSTIRLLNFCGASVVVPKSQSCCGALSWHGGNAEQARRLAAKNFELFLDDSDWVVTNAAGCGSGMKEYDVLFAGTAEEQNGRQLAEKTIDISVLLFRLGLPDKLAKVTVKLEDEVRVAYHDACHLSHGQGIRSEPRSLLRHIPGVELLELPGPEICCGSAGSYNIEQPEIAQDLGNQKAAAIESTNADFLVTGNIGCMVQIEKSLRQRGCEIPVMHLVDFLAEMIPESD